MALRVFPPNVTQPRKSSLKKPKTSNVPASTGQLQGVAFQINPERNSPGIVQPAQNHIKHSLFCDPSTSNSSASHHGSVRRQQRASIRSSAASDNTLIDCEPPEGRNESQLSPLPENNPLEPPTALMSHLAPSEEHLVHPRIYSTQAQPDIEGTRSPGGDMLTALPTRDGPEALMYSAPLPSGSTSPTLVLGDSPQSTVPPYSPQDITQSRSIFPQYDPSRPLEQQQYYPHVRSPTPTLPREKVSKVSSPVDKNHSPQHLRFEHAAPTSTVVDGYEHIPIAGEADLHAVFNASCNNFPVAARKVLFRLTQPRVKGTTLAIGTSQENLLYSMKKDSTLEPTKDSAVSELLVITKHSPDRSNTTTAARLALPNPAKQNKDFENELVTVFPQLAAINAVETVSHSPAAAEIAKLDPTGASPEAQRLAQDAVTEAYRRCGARLTRARRTRDSLGAVTATYKLEHPMVGTFTITVTKSTLGRHSQDPRAKISLHHPTATPAAVTAETLVLAFLDFACDACVLDVPGIVALEGPYIVDTVVCALLAVAVIENDALMADLLTFEAPPKEPLPTPKQSPRSHSTESVSKKSKRRLRRNKKESEAGAEQVDLPIVTRGALSLLGFSFKAAVWTLEVGVRVAAGIVIGTTHLVSKA